MKKLLLFATLLLLTACQETLEDRCARECKEYTQKKCPVLVTNGVTLDSMTFNTAALKLYKDAGYSFRYVYHSSKEKGTRVLDTTFRKKDYQ